jgi:hypothetical protein
MKQRACDSRSVKDVGPASGIGTAGIHAVRQGRGRIRHISAAWEICDHVAVIIELTTVVTRCRVRLVNNWLERGDIGKRVEEESIRNCGYESENQILTR